MSEQLLAFFIADSGVRLEDEKQGEPKLVWKVVLRTGTWKLRPGPGGVKLKEPLKIYRDKAPKGHISMSSLVKNFEGDEKGPAKENVTIPLVHADGTISDSGFVRKLVIQDVMGEDGSKTKESLLWAGLDITEPDIRGKVERKTLVGVSGGVLFDYERTEDAKKFDQILSHVTLTNVPWINGTGGFKDKLPDGVMASESDDLPVGELEPEVEEPEAQVKLQTDPPGKYDGEERKPPVTEGTIVWKPTEGFAWIRGKLQRALEEHRRMLMAQFRQNGQDPYLLDFPYYGVDDVQGNGKGGKALICSGYGAEKEAWVAGYKIEASEEGHDVAAIDPFQDWTPAKSEWVAASEQPPPPAPSAAPMSLPHRRQDAQSELRRAQNRRAERLGLNQTTTTGGTRVGTIADLLASKGVELSAEERETIQREEAEAERLRNNEKDRVKTDRESQTKVFLESLKDTPFDTPGTKKYIQGIMLGDDGGPAVESVELSDSGSKTHDKPLTATGIIKGLFDSLSKDKDGKLTLSAQATRLPSDPKPPAENPGEESNAISLAEARKRADDLATEAAEAGFDLGYTPAKTGGGS